MRKFFNIYLSLIVPLSILFIILATAAFMMDYEFSKAIKLGVLSGFLISIAATALISALLLFMREARAAHIARNYPEQTIVHTAQNGPIDKSFILLMDRAMAFDLTIQAIIDQQIGEVAKDSRRKNGNITVFVPGQTIKLLISNLTKHTAKVSISSNIYSEEVIAIINYLKHKEYTFLKY